MDTVTFTILAPPDQFIQWLQTYTKTAHLDFFPTIQGGYTVQPVSEPVPVGNAAIITIDAFYWDGTIPRSGAIHPHKNAITFKISQIGQQESHIQSQCHLPAIATYHNDLIVAIFLHWPETQPQLVHIDLLNIDHDDDPANGQDAPLHWLWPISDESND